MISDMLNKHGLSSVLAPRWLTARCVAIAVLVIGAAAVAVPRVDAVPGVLVTGGMLLMAWAPQALRMARPWVRWFWGTWTLSVVVLYLAWWAIAVQRTPLPPGIEALGMKRFALQFFDPMNGSHVKLREVWILQRVAVGFALAGLLASFRVVWQRLRREIESPADDSARQLTVLACAWLALAGCVGAADAFSRPDAVLELWASPWCEPAEPPALQLCRDLHIDLDRCPVEAKPNPGPKPTICQEGPSLIDAQMPPCEFCRDLTHPTLRRNAGRFAAGSACLGLLVAVGAARRLRRRARWIERVGDGSVEGWSLAYYAPTWGRLAAIPRLVGGVEPTNLALTCLVVRRPSAAPQQDASYRDLPAQGEVVGRLDSTPWLGGLDGARRGEDDVRLLLRAFAYGFALAIVPVGVAGFYSMFLMGR
jgi:hypothetical protein